MLSQNGKWQSNADSGTPGASLHIMGKKKCQKATRCVLLGLCFIVIPLTTWLMFRSGATYLLHYLPCPDLFTTKLQYREDKALPLFPQLFYPQPKTLKPRRTDVLTLTPWLAPVVWEGTFSSDMLDSVYKPLNLTIGVTAFAIGKYLQFVGRFLDSAEKHFMVGYHVNYYIFTDNPQEIPFVRLQPGRSLSLIPIRKHKSWQEISMRRMEAINLHISETIHREANYLFCLDIDMVFHNSWGPETLGDMVAAIHPGYYNVPSREAFPYERRKASAAYISSGEGDFYYGGAVFGGLVKNVYEFTRACHMTILADKANGIMAAWQEESHLNRHFLSHKPSKVLSPEYLWDDRKPKPSELRIIRFSTVSKNYKELRD